MSERVQCKVCGRHIALYTDGRIRTHVVWVDRSYPRVLCRGGGWPPSNEVVKQEVAAGRGVGDG